MPTPQKQANDKINFAVDLYMTGMFLEPIIGYSWVQSLKDAGYSDTYADARCSELWDKAQEYMLKLKQELKTKLKWDLEWVDQQYRDLYASCRTSSDKTNAKGCLDSMSRRLSGFTDNLNTNKDKPDELSEHESDILADAANDAKIKLSQTA